MLKEFTVRDKIIKAGFEAKKALIARQTENTRTTSLSKKEDPKFEKLLDDLLSKESIDIENSTNAKIDSLNKLLDSENSEVNLNQIRDALR